MKKLVCALLSVLLLASVFAGCKSRELVEDTPVESTEKKKTVTEKPPESVTTPGREVKESKGLKFESNRDGTCRVTGIGSCTDKDVVVPFSSPDGEVVTSISDNAFNAALIMESITISDNITRIGAYAFSDCRNLKSASIPDSVVVLGESAFSGCESLEWVMLSRNLLAIEDYTFSCCRKMKSITLPNSISYIGSGAFWGCTQLESVVIPENVTEIRAYAFRECRALKKIHIPKCVRLIGSKAFAGCQSLAEISVAPENDTFFGVQNCIVERKESKLIAIGNGFSIPSYVGIRAIGPGAICMEGEAADLTIPKSVTYFDFESITGCKNIFYEGTIGEWNSINKEMGWIRINGECQLTCIDGNRLDLSNVYSGGMG